MEPSLIDGTHLLYETNSTEMGKSCIDWLTGAET